MKKFLLATMAIATLFASCSKEPVEAQAGDGVIVVSLPGEINGRAIEAQESSSAVITLTDVTVFLLNNNSVARAVNFEPADLIAKKMRIENVPAGVNNVIVVANIPTAVGPTVRALLSGTAIENFAYTVASQNGSGISAVTRMGKGVPVVAVDPTPDGHDYKAVSIELTPLTARFEIGAVKPGTNVESVELIGVWINNYYTDATKTVTKLHIDADPVWNTSPATTGVPLMALPGTVSMLNAYTELAYYNAANNGAVTLTTSSQAYAYQVFAGSNIPHLILLVKGKYLVPDADGRQYFMGYVTFNKFENGGVNITAINANTIYKMGTGVTGIPINADDITPDPEMGVFDLGITVTTTPWTVLNVTPKV